MKFAETGLLIYTARGLIGELNDLNLKKDGTS